MTKYLIADEYFSSDDDIFQKILGDCYSKKRRPLCSCIEPKPEMYVAKINNLFVIKRMPNSGGLHAPDCESYEPPIELSGLGQVLGTAIQENPDDGTTSLRLDFSMTKTPGRSAPTPSGEEKDSVKTDGTKLTLRGTLHYLWEEAGFNRWYPAMSGKRNWYTIRKHLLNAAGGKKAKSSELDELLYVPENYDIDHKLEIAARRTSKLSKIAQLNKGAKKLMLVIGEVKKFDTANFGFKVILKHLPDYHFMINNDLYKRLNKRFAQELELWSATEDSHLIIIATFGVGVTGFASLEELALMVVNANWIPYENYFEKNLIDLLTENKRRYVKGLRYNLASTKPLACVVLADTTPATAMYVIPPGGSEEDRQMVDVLISESKLAAWVWDTESPMPALPLVEGI